MPDLCPKETATRRNRTHSSTSPRPRHRSHACVQPRLVRPVTVLKIPWGQPRVGSSPTSGIRAAAGSVTYVLDLAGVLPRSAAQQTVGRGFSCDRRIAAETLAGGRPVCNRQAEGTPSQPWAAERIRSRNSQWRVRRVKIESKVLMLSPRERARSPERLILSLDDEVEPDAEAAWEASPNAAWMSFAAERKGEGQVCCARVFRKARASLR